jgi:hypothetical protein
MSNQQWQEFIQTSTPTKDAGSTQPLLDSATVMCDLSHLGLLQLSGADAINFLQGQVTNDVKLLKESAHYTGYCTPKGRMLALFLAFSQHERIHLQMPIELIAATAKRLKMYVMRSKVEVQDVSHDIIKIGLSGPNAQTLLSTQFAKVPQHDYELVSLENGSLLKLPSSAHARFEILATIEQAQAIWSALSSQATVADAAHWEWLEIQAGIPDVKPETQEEFVPQMLNLDLLGGINFKKGCYTGQEIVARTHYLGSIKRRTYLTHSNHSAQPGENILNAANETVGKVVRSAPSPQGGYDLLAEIRCVEINLENPENNQLSANGHALALQALPYSL